MVAQAKFHAFDWDRMFLGDLPWAFTLEIIFRTVLMYLYALFLLRLLGKRGVGELSPFDAVIIFALGSAVGDPMFYPDIPLVHAMTVLTVVVLLQRGLIFLVDRSHRVQGFLQSQPRRLVSAGRLDLKGMEEENYSREELFMTLRQAGIEHLGQVKWAYLEPSGHVSAFLFPPKEVRPGLPLVPPYAAECPDCLHAGGPASQPGSYVCWSCGETIEVARKGLLPHCPHCGKNQWLAAQGGPAEQAT